jgi:uncharacterized membrane protein YwzB
VAKEQQYANQVMMLFSSIALENFVSSFFMLCLNSSSLKVAFYLNQ